MLQYMTQLLAGNRKCYRFRSRELVRNEENYHIISGKCFWLSIRTQNKPLIQSIWQAAFQNGLSYVVAQKVGGVGVLSQIENMLCFSQGSHQSPFVCFLFQPMQRRLATYQIQQRIELVDSNLSRNQELEKGEIHRFSLSGRNRTTVKRPLVNRTL